MYKVKDYYFNKAKTEHYLARSVYKLKEINEKIRLIKPNDIVLDLGAYPGSWAQYVTSLLSPKGALLAIDLQEILFKHARMKSVVDDVFLLNKDKCLNYLGAITSHATGFNLMLSDMAPKTSGIKHVDQINSFYLAEKVLDLSVDLLSPHGHVLIKVFGQQETTLLYQRMQTMFMSTKYMRPQSIRSISSEIYLLGLHKKSY